MILFAYIGPGPGFAVQAPALAFLVGLGAALMALLTFPLRWLWRRPKARQASGVRRVVVVGLDGLEPTLAERWMEEGRLPHLRALAQQGCYQRLATTCPPLSPVAWSSFATGVNPGKHGIFGFLHRTRDFKPFLSFSQVEEVPYRLGPLRLPWNRSRPRMLRRSKSFWTVLGEYGVFSHVVRVPVTWPAEPFHGALLSAMGVPDLRGSQGTYTLFATQQEDLKEGELVLLESISGAYRGLLRLPGLGQLELVLRGQELRWQGRVEMLQVGRPSRWREIEVGRARGIVQFLLIQADPPRLYMTPMQIDPEHPSLPISSPPQYSVALAKLLGKFATCGLAEDTGGREDGVLSQQDFLDQAYGIHQERELQFFHALERTRQGLCMAVFDGTDRIQHMAMQDEAVIGDLYERMDGLVGRVAERLGSEDVLVVMSDHGFKPLTRTIDINAWLCEQGYLATEGQGVDWSRTRVYALGLAGLHFNVRGRDAQGCLDPAEVATLKREIIEKLEGLVDPSNQQKPISRVFEAASVYNGPYLDRGPDLVIGYACGYRISKAAARGEVGEVVFEDNLSAWCGDHCLDPELVPGVLFANHPLAPQADIRDLAPTILKWFGVTPPAFIEGRCLNL